MSKKDTDNLSQSGQIYQIPVSKTKAVYKKLSKY
ncbi:Hypothetical protein CFV354_1874 [Campylobacter fetus subsp. venerealis NCTC 10354]|nr:Hypothetical protein CFV354_1874 [Campylobacter fetus subsp. venerealis NCTC 10354]